MIWLTSILLSITLRGVLGGDSLSFAVNSSESVGFVITVPGMHSPPPDSRSSIPVTVVYLKGAAEVVRSHPRLWTVVFPFRQIHVPNGAEEEPPPPIAVVVSPGCGVFDTRGRSIFPCISTSPAASWYCVPTNSPGLPEDNPNSDHAPWGSWSMQCMEGAAVM